MSDKTTQETMTMAGISEPANGSAVVGDEIAKAPALALSPLTPRQQLQLQVWQTAHFAISNAMLEATDRGDNEDETEAYRIMDMCRDRLNIALQKIEAQRARK